MTLTLGVYLTVSFACAILFWAACRVGAGNDEGGDAGQSEVQP